MSETPAPPPLRILHLEDSVLDHQLAERALARAGVPCAITRVDDLAGFEEAVSASPGAELFDVILADYNLPGFTALDAWATLQRQSHKPPFIVLSGAIGERAAVEAIKLGVSDYLSKDDLTRLGPVILRAIDVHQTRLDKTRADAELAASEKRLAGFAEHLQTAIEQERAGIAREIHDDIGGALAAIGFDLAWIARNSADEGAKHHALQASGMLHQAMSASQGIMMNLRPAILDQGLVAAVQWLAGGFTKRTGIETTVHAFPEKGSLSRAVQLVAYRTAQEALTNIAKYADCDQVTIDLSDAENVLTLEVKDNGKGISQTELNKPTAFGIRGLHERAKTVGGWLDVSTHCNTGTSIILSVPLLPPHSGTKQGAD